ncbi:DUF1638 domain-containing protein [Candidatus Poriferisodalis sp.]|uniref:DUF1638 domain-containing protein n=1 Tax=Candidatus Poriferisodalis sp. TaxID=3101277 RepID=UPI003C7043F6
MATPSAPAAIPSSSSPAASGVHASAERILVLACGALVNELQAIVGVHGLDHVDVECLPAKLHNRPSLIAGAVRERIARLQATGRTYQQVLLGYADCGTAGTLDDLCEEFTAKSATGGAPAMSRIEGAHCYEFFATAQRFAEMSEAEPATFYLTDYLARHFDLLVWRGLGIADHPELAELYFGNYRRVVLLTQTPDGTERARITEFARAGAERLGLPLEIVETGYGDLETALIHVAAPRGRSVIAQVPA